MDARGRRNGQSLIELIVALAVGTVLIVAGVAAITPVLKTTGDIGRIQTATALGKELLENVRVLSERDWHAIDSLATTSQYKYYLQATSSPFIVRSGTESVLVATTTYTRYFYLDDVSRNASDQISTGTGATLDPSTKRITVVYSWPRNASNTIVSYLTRSRNEVLIMSDWSGGGNQDGVVTATTTNAAFSTSSNIDYSGTGGSIVIQGF